MKKMKWLRKLPIFVLALIIAVSPLMMAVDAQASSGVLGASDYPDIDGYEFVCPVEIDGYPILFYVQNYILSYDRPIVITGFGNELGFLQEDNISVKGGSIYFDNEGPDVELFLFSSMEQREIGGHVCFLLGDIVFPSFEVQSPVYVSSLLIANSLVHVDTSSLPDGFPVFRFPSSSVGILSVFSGIGSWLSGAIGSMTEMFWTAESGMTVLGYLAVASLALAVILLIFSLIAGWLKFH